MPSKIELTAVSEKDLRKIKDLPPMEVFEAKWPKRASTAAQAKTALKTWQQKLPVPKPPENPPIKIKAVEPTPARLSRLAAVVNSDSAQTEMLGQQLDANTYMGMLLSAFLVHRFMVAESEHKRRALGRTRKEAEVQWPEIVSAFQNAFAAAGMRGVTEEQMSKYVKDFVANQPILDAVTKIVNSAKPLKRAAEDTAPTAISGTFVPQTAKLLSLPPIIIVIPNLCTSPIAQGTFTQHLGGNFALTVNFQAPCVPKFWKLCWYSVTVTASYSLDLKVGYTVDCCKVSVWGQGAAQACVGITGLGSVCASISGAITGLGTVTKSPTTGGNCSYTLGINASLQGTFQGYTLFSFSVPFGYTVTGPCPPPQLPC